jgi:hypothetical protein
MFLHVVFISNFNINFAADLIFSGVITSMHEWTNSMQQSHSWEAITAVLQLVKKFLALYATYRFSTMFIRAHHIPLLWTKLIQFMLSNPICYKSILTSDVVHLPCNSLIHTDFTTNCLHNVYVHYTVLLHVSAIRLGHLQGGTSLIDVYEGVSKIFCTDAVRTINLTIKRVWKLPTSTQLRAS